MSLTSSIFESKAEEKCHLSQVVMLAYCLAALMRHTNSIIWPLAIKRAGLSKQFTV